MTPYGVKCLTEEVPDRQICVLYKGGRFYTGAVLLQMAEHWDFAAAALRAESALLNARAARTPCCAVDCFPQMALLVRVLNSPFSFICSVPKRRQVLPPLQRPHAPG